MKSLEWRVVLAVGVIALLAAIANNIRVPTEKQVTWFGGQQVLVKPEGY